MLKKDIIKNHEKSLYDNQPNSYDNISNSKHNRLENIGIAISALNGLIMLLTIVLQIWLNLKVCHLILCLLVCTLSVTTFFISKYRNKPDFHNLAIASIWFVNFVISLSN